MFWCYHFENKKSTLKSKSDILNSKYSKYVDILENLKCYSDLTWPLPSHCVGLSKFKFWPDSSLNITLRPPWLWLTCYRNWNEVFEITIAIIFFCLQKTQQRLQSHLAEECGTLLNLEEDTNSSRISLVIGDPLEESQDNEVFGDEGLSFMITVQCFESGLA